MSWAPYPPFASAIPSVPPAGTRSLQWPHYYYQLRTYPATNPILIAVDHRSVQAIHRHRGVCLYCPEPPEAYTLGFCYHREVWVLYARLAFFSRAMALAQTIQWQGAAQITVLRLESGVSP